MNEVNNYTDFLHYMGVDDEIEKKHHEDYQTIYKFFNIIKNHVGSSHNYDCYFYHDYLSRGDNALITDIVKFETKNYEDSIVVFDRKYQNDKSLEEIMKDNRIVLELGYDKDFHDKIPTLDSTKEYIFEVGSPLYEPYQRILAKPLEALTYARNQEANLKYEGKLIISPLGIENAENNYSEIILRGGYFDTIWASDHNVKEIYTNSLDGKDYKVLRNFKENQGRMYGFFEKLNDKESEKYVVSFSVCFSDDKKTVSWNDEFIFSDYHKADKKYNLQVNKYCMEDKLQNKEPEFDIEKE